MAQRRALVAGNWKMNGSRAQATALVNRIARDARALEDVELVLCPPFVLIPLVAELLRASGARIACGGQNLHAQAAGAYTGEVSGPMLRDYDCTYVIVGHSERRTLFGESDAVVAEKFGAAHAAQLVPIVCVGETLAEREAGKTEAVVERQLAAVLNKHGVGAFRTAVIAYEPVWAIGTGRTATPEQAQSVHATLRRRLGEAGAAEVLLLYGGSVKADNAKTLFAQEDIDGGLIGGASLKASEFLAIANA